MPKHQAVHGQILFTMDTALPAPRAPRLLSWETLYEKDIPDKAGREMCLCLSGWCHSCMQNCRALDCRREDREAQDRGHVYCLQDEAARKDKAGMQSTTASHCCHL